MCAEFLIRGNIRKALRKSGVPVSEKIEDEILERRIRMYSEAPIAVMRKGKVVLEDKGFSLRPKDVPFSTHNARLESWDEKKKKVISIFDKPTWKKPFITSRCLVPVSAFVEPIYQGDHAGEMVQFHSNDDEMMFAAGIYAESTNKESGEVYDGFVGAGFKRDRTHRFTGTRGSASTGLKMDKLFPDERRPWPSIVESSQCRLRYCAE